MLPPVVGREVVGLLLREPRTEKPLWAFGSLTKQLPEAHNRVESAWMK